MASVAPKALVLVTLTLCLAACEDSNAAAERFRERQRKYDPLQLWSVQVTWPERSSPITICADTFIREGFVRPLPNYAGKQCALHEPPTVMPTRVVMRCTLNDNDYLVRARVFGDPRSEFDLDYVIKGPGPDVRQIRHYKKLGPCPAGWEIGDNTDRRGKLRKNAMH
jgi:hypothetical protein